MLETMSDILSLAVMCLCVLGTFGFMVSINNVNTSEKKRKRQNRWVDFYETVEDEYDDERSGPYFE